MGIGPRLRSNAKTSTSTACQNASWAPGRTSSSLLWDISAAIDALRPESSRCRRISPSSSAGFSTVSVAPPDGARPPRSARAPALQACRWSCRLRRGSPDVPHARSRSSPARHPGHGSPTPAPRPVAPCRSRPGASGRGRQVHQLDRRLVVPGRPPMPELIPDITERALAPQVVPDPTHRDPDRLLAPHAPQPVRDLVDIDPIDPINHDPIPTSFRTSWGQGVKKQSPRPNSPQARTPPPTGWFGSRAPTLSARKSVRGIWIRRGGACEPGSMLSQGACIRPEPGTFGPAERRAPGERCERWPD